MNDNPPLQKIVGKKILNAEFLPVPESHDDFCLTFDGGFGITIYNPVQCLGFSPDKSNSDLRNLKVLKVREREEEIIFECENDMQFIVDLRDEAWEGPEAMVMDGPENLTVVWN